MENCYSKSRSTSYPTTFWYLIISLTTIAIVMQPFCEKMPQCFTKHLFFQTVLLLILSGRGTCQDSTYLVEPGVHPAKVIPVSKQFRYPEFREGRVLLSTGKQSEPLLLNYSLLYDAVMLIGANSDTVWL